jgi:site-specific recombinase XerD
MSTQTIIEFEIQYSNLLQALELQGKAPRTIAIYSTEIRKAFKYFNTTLDKVSQDDLKKYFFWMIKNYSWSVVKQSRSAMQFLWKHVYDKKWTWVDIVKPPVLRRSAQPNVPKAKPAGRSVYPLL